MKKESKFIKIDSNEFDSLSKQPLWTLLNAILYVNGMKSSEKKSEKILLFIRAEKDLAELALFITQAYKTDSLDLIPNTNGFNFNFDGFFDTTTQPNYSLISGYSIKPDQFINFVKSLPLEFPILDRKTFTNSNKPLHKKERDSLIKLFIGLAVCNYGLDNIKNDEVKASEISKDIRINSGIDIDDDTARKFLREGLEVLKKYE